MIFVTGGTGIVGIRILFDLITLNKEVLALKRANSDLTYVKKAFQFYDQENGIQKFDKIKWLSGDILDVVCLTDAMENCDQVYHAAALVSFKSDDRDELMDVNILGTANMVNIALEKGIERFCYISSVAALGRGGKNELTDESSEWGEDEKPNNYGVSKYFAEMEVWRGKEEGLNVTILCPSVIIGAGNPNKSSAQLFSRTYKGMKYFGPGKNALVDVRTISSSAIQLMELQVWGERFIVSAENISYQTLFTKIASGLGRSGPNRKAKKWQMDIVSVLSKILGSIGFSISVSPENMRSAQALYAYDNSKLTKALQVNYPKADDTINYFSKYYLELFETS